jgi:hypothetical protein
MSVPNLENPSYSTDARMRLCVNGRVFLIGQLGPDFIMLDDPVDQPPAEGAIAVSIDGRERRWPVHLPDGVAAAKPETRITDCPAAANGSTGG